MTSFHHAPEIWASFPSLTPVVVLATGLRPLGPVDAAIEAWTRRAAGRLGAGTESDLPQVQAWRRAFASGRSAVTDHTTDVLIVAEALHDGAAADMAELGTALAGELTAGWGAEVTTALLRPGTVFPVSQDQPSG